MRVELTPNAWTLLGPAPLLLRISTFPSKAVYVLSPLAPVSLDVVGLPVQGEMMITGDGDVYAKSLDDPSSLFVTDIDLPPTAKEIAKLVALPIPPYLVNDLPLANLYAYAVVRIIDNPQGQAESNGLDWISTVDGSNLGPGHA